MKQDRSSDARSPLSPTQAQIDSSPRPPALALDPEEYRHFLDDCDWTQAQKDEFIQALWSIVVGFVDLGFGLHPVQFSDDRKTLELDSPGVLPSEDISETLEAKAADGPEWPSATGVDS